MSHPNILRLLGVSMSKNPRHFRIISEWMPNGNVMEYISSNLEANRWRLVSSVVCSLWSLYVLITATRSFPRLRLVLHTFTNSGLRTEISKECATTLYTVFASLTVIVGEYSHRPHRDRSPWGFWFDDHDRSEHEPPFQYCGPFMWNSPLDES